MHDQNLKLLPVFSIAIPTFNRLELLKRAISSVLAQTYSNIELLVLNNASTDGTKEWLDDFVGVHPRVKVVHNAENLGSIGNVKSIPKYITGQYLLVLSDDDLLEKDFVKEAVNDLSQNKDATIWYCRANFLNLDYPTLNLQTMPAPLCEDGKQFIKKSLLKRRDAFFCATVFKVDTLTKIGGFIGKKISVDFSTRCLCAARGQVLFNPKCLANYCWHGNNESITSSAKKWFDANKEIQELVLEDLGKKYEFPSVYYRFRCIESLLSRQGMLFRESFYFCAKLFLEYPGWFFVILIIRFPFVLIRLLPKSIFEKFRKLYWKIKQ